MIQASDGFYRRLAGGIIPLDFDGRISLTKRRNQNVKWFMLNGSQLDGADLLATLENNVEQMWDAYDYERLNKDRLLDLKVARSVEFPYNVQSATADFSLNNYDHKFDFGDNAGVLPRRPVRFYGGTTSEKVPVFVGMTQKLPSYDEMTASWTALDFLSEIAESELPKSAKMRNVTTDQVIAEILRQFGMNPAQFKLSKGQNTIPFVKFSKGDSAGAVLKKLVQAENGRMWLDELGIVRFTARSGSLGKKPVAMFNNNNVIDVSKSQTDGVVNHVKIESEVRAVQARQVVFQKENTSTQDDDEWIVKANRSMETWLTLDDPVMTMDEVAFNNTNSSSVEATSLDGATAITSGVQVTAELMGESVKLTVYNQRSSSVRVSKVELWGEPAKVVDTIKYEAKDPDSIEIFGDQLLEIDDNDFFGSYPNCSFFGRDVLSKHSEYSPTVELTAKINPALQLGDIVELELEEIEGSFEITALELDFESCEMKLNLKRYTVMDAFILDESVLNGKDVLG